MDADEREHLEGQIGSLALHVKMLTEILQRIVAAHDAKKPPGPTPGSFENGVIYDPFEGAIDAARTEVKAEKEKTR